MDYEENLIDGTLHWRCTPDGEWQPMSKEKLAAIVPDGEWQPMSKEKLAAIVPELRKWFYGQQRTPRGQPLIVIRKDQANE